MLRRGVTCGGAHAPCQMYSRPAGRDEASAGQEVMEEYGAPLLKELNRLRVRRCGMMAAWSRGSSHDELVKDRDAQG